ncbi:lytic transglycosylase [Pseudoxanthomonas kalamensis]|uniref:lytic transglycosylase n=1 Tax=Pseudoxanthomonas kalamensis TaxID=289483 RepID=UPI001FE3E7DF|nr:transglycosylase SLT domain-containing protein [Pseudoxanthomonas kalamensis]
MCRWLLPAFLALFAAVPSAHAQRVSARDKAAIEVIDQRMAAAEQRYRDALVLVANNDPRGAGESNAALEDMEDVIDACIKQRGCSVNTQLAAFKRLLKEETDALAGDDEETDDPLDDGSDHALAEGAAAATASASSAAQYHDGRHAFDRMVEFNPAVQAGIRRWLTDMRSSLITSYENYMNLRPVMWPEWERNGLPEALLFGIMAKESNGRAHSRSRAGAAGLMQFMPATGSRFGLGPDGTGFDTRYDARATAAASADYILERLHELNDNVELSLAAYNGGEGRALRVYSQYPGRSFWDETVYNQFPAETRDYVPMVIAAAWLFLHPKQYGLEFPKVNAQLAQFKLSRDASIYEMTICMGNGGTREGYMRALRNLNPRYQADQLIPAGTTMLATTRMSNQYKRHCIDGERAQLARTLVGANVYAALQRPPQPEGSVAVGDVTPVTAPPPKPKPKPARTYRVKAGDSLGRIAQRNGCSLKTLARANGVHAPRYSVRQGQVLKLEGCSK